ncbi:MAG: DUF4258 domain-containing protein [Planctomycetota bacterium]
MNHPEDRGIKRCGLPGATPTSDARFECHDEVALLRLDLSRLQLDDRLTCLPPGDPSGREEALTRPLEDRPGRDGSRLALGQTAAGRYLRVVYVPDPEPDFVFVITVYDLRPKVKHGLRRRRRRKP